MTSYLQAGHRWNVRRAFQQQQSMNRTIATTTPKRQRFEISSIKSWRSIYLRRTRARGNYQHGLYDKQMALWRPQRYEDRLDRKDRHCRLPGKPRPGILTERKFKYRPRLQDVSVKSPFFFTLLYIDSSRSTPEDELPQPRAEDLDYYTKVFLLGAIHGPEPITTNTGLGSVFLSATDAAKLTERERFRLVKDLPAADHLSLFMVSRADGDVAATCIVYAELGSIHIYIAKNETALEDEHHMLRLMGLCSGDVRRRYQDFPAFAYKALEFITPFCNGKGCGVCLSFLLPFRTMCGWFTRSRQPHRDINIQKNKEYSPGK
jgi:hypothetical protein